MKHFTTNENHLPYRTVHVYKVEVAFTKNDGQLDQQVKKLKWAKLIITFFNGERSNLIVKSLDRTSLS